MKTLLIYYSYTGSTRKIAQKIAEEQNAEVLELKEVKKRSKVGAYIAGSFAAMRHKKANLEPFDTYWETFDKIIIAMPIWAGSPAPAMNNIIEHLPKGKEVELYFVSGGGDSKKSCEFYTEMIGLAGAKVVKCEDIKA